MPDERTQRYAFYEAEEIAAKRAADTERWSPPEPTPARKRELDAIERDEEEREADRDAEDAEERDIADHELDEDR